MPSISSDPEIYELSTRVDNGFSFGLKITHPFLVVLYHYFPVI